MLLIEKGADANAQGGYYGNSLQTASYGGHEAIEKLLIEKGADVNALQAALSTGHEALAKLLKEKGADESARLTHTFENRLSLRT